MTITEAERQDHGGHDERKRERSKVGEKDRWEEEETKKKKSEDNEQLEASVLHLLANDKAWK